MGHRVYSSGPLRFTGRMVDLELIQKASKGLFPDLLGVEIIEASADGITAELEVRDELCTIPGRLHGGAVMAFADTLGAVGTVLNLPPGAGTTTVESKTNFFGSGTPGMRLRGESVPLHRGRSTMVWQTRITQPDGKLVALVTQTQMVLPAPKSPADQMAGLFAKGETPDHQALLATLERSGGALYRAWAEAESDPEKKAALLEAAEREDRNAELLESLAKDSDA
jgi:1,4-dihydroxy-2-naphthoyl-CoA hydrolase